MIICSTRRWPRGSAGLPAARALAAIAEQLSLTADVTRLRVRLAMRHGEEGLR